MVAPLILNTNSDHNSNNIIALSHNSDGTGSKRDEVLDVYFCNSGFHNDLKLGPTPLITISREFIKDGAGSYIGINNKINLNGKIYDSGNPGIEEILKVKENNLKDLLRRGVGNLEIKKEGGGSNLLGDKGGKNAKVIGYSVNQTPDAWLFSADYSIDFAYYEPIDKSNYRVSSITESWSLEPIGELVYLALTKAVQKRTETEPTSATTMNNVMVTGLPQFKLTRRLAAVGIRDEEFISHDKSSRHTFNNSGAAQDRGENDAYLQAKKWIEDRLNLPFDTGSNSRADYTTRLADAYNISSFTNLFLCNHTRNINFSITDGSYEVNDTWLALPSGVRYTEEFTIESSTDEKYIKTVRVQGTIKGLRVENAGVVTTNTDIPNNTGKIGLSKYAAGGQGGAVGGKPFSAEKYYNAKNAWLDDIKPSLYTRACLALRSPDRTVDYYPPGYNGGTAPPNNPAFSKENLLNIIPVSSSESHDSLKGVIGYTYEYNNSTKIFSGVIAESVSIDSTGPAHVMAEIFVFGRPLGPVIQDLGTQTACTKSVNIELIIPPPTTSAAFNMKNSSCPVWTGGYIFQTCEAIIEGQKPYGKRHTENQTLPSSSTKGVYDTSEGAYNGDVFVKSDTYSWSPSEGRYTRNVEWVFQPKTGGVNSYAFLRLNGS
jgi:hypothetical protein